MGAPAREALGVGAVDVRQPPHSTFKIWNTLIALETGAAPDAGFQQRYDPVKYPRGLVAGDLAAGPDAGERIPALGGVVLPGAGPSCGGGGDANPALPAGLRQRGHLQRARQLLARRQFADFPREQVALLARLARGEVPFSPGTWRPCGGSWCWTGEAGRFRARPGSVNWAWAGSGAGSGAGSRAGSWGWRSGRTGPSPSPTCTRPAT